ncbi:hypothetical protein JF729_06940 [Mycobacterium intracellulare]|nr:hypothetical protein [Mycobacterium intracellulare]MCA2247531.1 hypothetical protein [Mycobacterium intracellulare]
MRTLFSYDQEQKVVLVVLLAFAVSTTSVSCVPPYCPLTGGPAVIC